ncbi:hypothetical protein KUF71_008807 [Frankliniella fusca]|uniref:Uncharacterized protein n=1 Tax=Frankliniella fusca TaxID=407009 RepID=A0AAE1HFM3_9NEOP|nr:hypothetical protein KUF71_008807 [Frankliniella fusca]
MTNPYLLGEGIAFSTGLPSFRLILISLSNRKAAFLVVADALSRLPAPTSVQDLTVNTITTKVATELPVTIHLGWPPKDALKSNPAIEPYFKLRDHLTILGKCLMFSSRVVIPASLRNDVRKLIHAGHPGIVRSIMLDDISNMVSNCQICAQKAQICRMTQTKNTAQTLRPYILKEMSIKVK